MELSHGTSWGQIINIYHTENGSITTWATGKCANVCSSRVHSIINTLLYYSAHLNALQFSFIVDINLFSETGVAQSV
jgi:hypothetical protein